MSDNVLKLIPTSPECKPDSERLKEACDLLASFFPQAGKVAAEATEELRFIDPGQNLERVVCPICGTELDMVWWQNAMNVAYQNGFTDLLVALPCCGTISSLNDLHYEWPAGFARFVLEVHNPKGELEDAQLHHLEATLDCTLRKIKAHY